MIRPTTWFIAGWMFAVATVLGVLLVQQDLVGTHIYRVGPNSDLVILGFSIDTLEKYWLVATFCFFNSGVHTLNVEILRPWITNQVQDTSQPLNVSKIDAYVISCIATSYGWFDFFFYMNILLAQIDMMVIEVCADLTVTIVVTTWYVNR